MCESAPSGVESEVKLYSVQATLAHGLGLTCCFGSPLRARNLLVLLFGCSDLNQTAGALPHPLCCDWEDPKSSSKHGLCCKAPVVKCKSISSANLCQWATPTNLGQSQLCCRSATPHRGNVSPPAQPDRERRTAKEQTVSALAGTRLLSLDCCNR